LQHNVGVDLPSSAARLRIAVQVTKTPGQTALWLVTTERIVVPSPAVYRAPVTLSDTELLVQSIMLPLLDNVIAQVAKHDRLGSRWQPMLRGLRLWQLWDLDLPLATWRQDVVQWLYLDLPTSEPRQPLPLPNRYPALCSVHKLWLPSPLQIDIPFICTEHERGNPYLALGSRRDLPTQLDQLTGPTLLDEDTTQAPAPDPGSYVGRAVVWATLIEYAVATYGRERLPALLAGMGQHASWETLLPAVYGVSPAEFETGWQEYLTLHYRQKE
jgi:hypothetical protein